MVLVITLPFPPSINHMWKISGKRKFLSAAGRKFREEAITSLVKQELAGLKMPGRVKVRMELYPPCRRKRDIDNYPKSVFDALTHAEVWIDDEQVDELQVVRCDRVKGGEVRLVVTEIETP